MSTAARVTVPYLLLEQPGWILNGTATLASMPDGLPFRGIWTTSYEGRLEPSRSVGVAMMIAMPDRTPSALAAEFKEPVNEVRINGTPGVAVEERSTQDGRFIATHVLWTIDSYVAWFTGYELHQADAVALAEAFKKVPEEQWRTAADQAD